MKIKRISNNETEVTNHAGVVILFSYDTPVLFSTEESLLKTTKFHSSTTSKHINQALRRWGAAGFERGVDQTLIDQLVEAL